MEKTYNPLHIEQHWYQQWEQANYFAPSGTGKPYCIMIPPPNVTGSLHMGHGFQHTLMDILVRYHRMCGDNTLWQVGTDHAGIATQMVVERQLLQKDISRHELGREKFVEKVWEWKHQSGGTITSQMRRLGISVDWKRERFTLNEDLSAAVEAVFIQLYDQGLIYRGQRLVNWDPQLGTAISDLEVLKEEEDGELWHIRYPFADGSGYLTVATSRPETLLGDVAVAVHPDDARYQAMIGKQLILPLVGRSIPVIADEYVDPAFGTGCVKITPAHDFNDYEVGVRHQLALINIFTRDAHINENAPQCYQGLERYEARKRMVADLTAQGLIDKITQHRRPVPRGDRSGTMIEPYLTYQWYVKMQPLAEPAIDAVKLGQIHFIPENWRKTYFQWLENIEDWCISRQLWWGHRIPAWYDDDGKIYVAPTAADARKKYKLSPKVNLRQDDDVLDTWFSSALWPFSTLGWPNETADLKTFYPTAVLVSGFDIIFFWIARMVMMGLKFTGEIPFKEVYITGLIRDNEGHKMSKTKGNVLDPIDLIDGITLEDLVSKRTQGLMQPAMAKKIEQATRKHFPEGIPSYGTDALRFTFCALATHGRNIRFELGRLEGYRNFCNKIWNATRFVMMNTENQDCGNDGQPLEFTLVDQWIQAELQTTIDKANHYLQSYRFDLLAQTLYEFIWNEYCDWYLEWVKPLLNNPESASAARGTRFTLIHVLETLLRLIHPIMPFITEEIWQKIGPLAGKAGATIMLEPYPQIDAAVANVDAVTQMNWLKDIILVIRNLRGEMGISPAKALPLLLYKGDTLDRTRIAQHHKLLTTLAKLEKITWLEADESVPASTSGRVNELEILIPIAGVIDIGAEVARLTKELDKNRKELQRVQQKLANPQFVENAPGDVVAKEQARMAEVELAIGVLEQQRERLG